MSEDVKPDAAEAAENGKKAEGAQRRGQKRAGSGKKQPLIVALICLPLALVLWPSFAILAISLSPTILAYFSERSQQKYLTYTIGMMNLCGSLPGLAAVWGLGHSHKALMFLLGDNLTWMLPFAFAGTGWLIYMLSSSVVAFYHRGTTRNRLEGLAEKQRELYEAWGPEVVTEQAQAYIQMYADQEQAEQAVASGAEDIEAQPAG